MKQAIWITYDLGIKGDYEGLYSWLADHEAKECGDNVAFLKYDIQDNLVEQLKQDLSAHVNLSKPDRIYLIWKENDKLKGHYLFGRRKAAPWTGYGSQIAEIDEEG